MLLYLIPVIILAGSLIGLAVILVRKIPILTNLPINVVAEQKPAANGNGKKLVDAVKEKINFEKILQKILSKVTISTLKIGNKTNAWLAQLRQRALKKKDNYWEKLQGKKEEKENEENKNLPTPPTTPE